MQPIVTNMAALAVASLFYFWRGHCQTRQRRRQILSERVAYMLWVMAGQVQGSDSGLTMACRR
jgi:hypothetical protein